MGRHVMSFGDFGESNYCSNSPLHQNLGASDDHDFLVYRYPSTMFDLSTVLCLVSSFIMQAQQVSLSDLLRSFNLGYRSGFKVLWQRGAGFPDRFAYFFFYSCNAYGLLPPVFVRHSMPLHELRDL
ncbi:hypothetical protein ACFE04_029711 [Oxalis oulophora]